jgi:hypothetical protein
LNFFTRVEEDQVSLLHQLCFFVALRGLQNIGHFVRVVLVHLAAKGFDEDFFGHNGIFECYIFNS